MTVTPEGPFLDFDLDPSLWLIGPTPDRPYDVWLPGAVDALCTKLRAHR